LNKQELSAISKYCRQNNLFLYLDGARIGSALMSHANDLSLAEISQYVDMFYIGGTKNGALLAKGRVLGIQFSELFRDDLFINFSLDCFISFLP
jgi:threonine aldolase